KAGVFLFLMFTARKVEFVKKDPQTNGYDHGELTKLQFQRGRAVYFEVAQDDGIVSGGNRPDPNVGPPDVWRQIFGGNRPRNGAAPVTIDVNSGVVERSRVVVCRYQFGGVDHYNIRDH